RRPACRKFFPLPTRWGGSGRGRSQAEFVRDLIDDGIKRIVDIACWDAHHSKALRFEVGGFALIRFLFVSFPINLDHQARLQTSEVSEIRADRKLAAKLEPPDLPAPEAVPDSSLCVAHVVPQLPGTVGLGRRHAITIA